MIDLGPRLCIIIRCRPDYRAILVPFQTSMPNQQANTRVHRAGPIRIHTKLDLDVHLTVHTVLGKVEADQVLATLCQFYRGAITRRVLWDLTDGTLSGIAAMDLRKLMRRAKTISRGEGKEAFLCIRDVDYGLVRMMGALAEMENYGYVLRAFRSRQEAEKWLGISGDSVDQVPRRG